MGVVERPWGGFKGNHSQISEPLDHNVLREARERTTPFEKMYEIFMKLNNSHLTPRQVQRVADRGKDVQDAQEIRRGAKTYKCSDKIEDVLSVATKSLC